MPKLAIIASTLLLAGAASADSLPLRVWQFQDYNMDHIKRLIDMAAEQHVNRIQLSHNIVMDVEHPLGNPQLVRDINTICQWADAKNIKVDMWTHELNGIPKDLRVNGKVDLDAPELWDFIRGKYRKLFDMCPDLDGLVLSMKETAMSIYDERSVESSISPEKRVAKLIDQMGSVCKSFNKQFFVRTFSYEPHELQFIKQGIIEAQCDFVVMSKCVPHDWQPYYPHNPIIGDVGGKPQIVEFDLGYEFLGLSTIPYINIDYLKMRLDHGVSRNILGAVLRIERLGWRAVDTPNQANIDVFTKMLLNPSADPHELYKQWLADRYGEQAVPHLFSAFMRTYDIVNKGYFVLGYWVTNHSKLPTYDYATKSLGRRTTAKWDPSTKPTQDELWNPTRQTIAKINAEKDEALALVNESIADIEKAKPFLSEKDYADLADLFQREKAMVVVWKAGMDIIFGVQVYQSTKSEDDKAFLLDAADRLEKLAAENKQHLVNMAADYGSPQRVENFYRANELVKLARKTAGG